MKRVLSECLKPSSAATTVRKAASEIIIIIDDDDDDDNDGGALSSLRQRAPRPLTCQGVDLEQGTKKTQGEFERNIPSHSQARQHDNNIDLTSPQFNTPSSRAQVIKPDKRKNNRIDLTSPKHVSKEGLKKKPVTKELSLMCSICMGKMQEETSTSCGHIFCKSCITQSLQHQKKCPTCRKKLSSNQIHRIYLSGSTLEL